MFSDIFTNCLYLVEDYTYHPCVHSRTDNPHYPSFVSSFVAVEDEKRPGWVLRELVLAVGRAWNCKMVENYCRLDRENQPADTKKNMSANYQQIMSTTDTCKNEGPTLIISMRTRLADGSQSRTDLLLWSVIIYDKYLRNPLG